MSEYRPKPDAASVGAVPLPTTASTDKVLVVFNGTENKIVGNVLGWAISPLFGSTYLAQGTAATGATVQGNSIIVAGSNGSAATGGGDDGGAGGEYQGIGGTGGAGSGTDNPGGGGNSTTAGGLGGAGTATQASGPGGDSRFRGGNPGASGGAGQGAYGKVLIADQDTNSIEIGNTSDDPVTTFKSEGAAVVRFDGTPRLPSYTVAGVPSASTAGQIAYISNETGGAVVAFSDGTNWRRVTDRAVISA